LLKETPIRIWFLARALGLAFCALPARAAKIPSDPAALDIADVFSHTCLHNGGQPRRVATWATQQKLPELSGTDARKALFADGVDGRVWLIHGPATDMYLAIQGRSGTCALYGTRADAADFAMIYDQYLQFLAPPGARVDRKPDHVTQGLFGTTMKRFATIHAAKGKIISFGMSANQKPGGPYQASLVMATQGAAPVGHGL